MKRGIHILLLTSFSLVFFSRCVSEYTVQGTEGLSDILVVEGFITDTESTFKLSRSVSISEPVNTYPAETRVQTMYVECTDGTQSDPAVHLGFGEYSIETGDLDIHKQYRLYFRLNTGEEFTSEFLTPLHTPEIDSISYVKTAKGQPVQMCVNTTEEKNQSRYFYWSYIEDWEVWAFLEAEYGLTEDYMIYKYEPSYNTYYCWGHDVSRKLLLASTDNLSENRLKNYALLEMSPSSDKLTVLYHIEVFQNLIRKEAYDYFYNLLKNTDQNSGLFTSMPTEIKGNIENLTHPDIPVIGYVEVSTTTSKSRYIDYSEGLFEWSGVYSAMISMCDQEEMLGPTSGKRPDEIAEAGYVPYTIRESMKPEMIYKPLECVDCRTRYKATKNKPDFWPGNRQ